MIIRVIDIETTGLDPAKDGAEPCEIAWTDLAQNGPGWHIGDCFSTLIKPAKPIPPTASAVHHITDDMVTKAPLWPVVVQELMHDKGEIVYASHRASFEQQFIQTSRRWICTWKCALHLAPKAPAHSLQVLRYWLKLDLIAARASPPHRAGPDSYVTASLLSRMLAKLTPEQCIEISAVPAILPHFSFGKHAGEPLEEVPADYLRWMLDSGKFDEDIVATCTHHIEMRSSKKQ